MSDVHKRIKAIFLVPRRTGYAGVRSNKNIYNGEMMIVKKHLFNLFVATIFITNFIPLVFSHGNEVHSPNEEKKLESKQKYKTSRNDVLQKINNDYLNRVKPIFKKKCFNCHSRFTAFPWYYKLPGIKNLIDYDIKEGKQHIDMSNDFPFGGHGEPIQDLESLKKIGEQGGMPPFRYIISNWEARLSKEDQQRIIEWTKKSIELLKKNTESPSTDK